jgi:predicted protein tyrosine phosphatase
MKRCLCLCNDGQVRSTTLARMLRKRGMEAIAAGASKLWSDETLHMLCNWAEVIYVMGSDSRRKFDERIKDLGISKASAQNITAKIDMRYNVGYDDWHVPDHPDLLARLRLLVEADATP